jgi:hypothetical protein
VLHSIAQLASRAMCPSTSGWQSAAPAAGRIRLRPHAPFPGDAPEKSRPFVSEKTALVLENKCIVFISRKNSGNSMVLFPKTQKNIPDNSEKFEKRKVRLRRTRRKKKLTAPWNSWKPPAPRSSDSTDAEKTGFCGPRRSLHWGKGGRDLFLPSRPAPKRRQKKITA